MHIDSYFTGIKHRNKITTGKDVTQHSSYSLYAFSSPPVSKINMRYLSVFHATVCSPEQLLIPKRVPQGKACTWTVTSEQLKCSKAAMYSPETVCHA